MTPPMTASCGVLASSSPEMMQTSPCPPVGASPPSPQPRGRPQEWHVPASDIARSTHNYIRSIVENMKIEPNPDKKMIALSIGDPTIFGNFRPPEEVVEAVRESLLSLDYNGYAPSSGYAEARDAVARYSSVDGVQVSAEDVVLCSGCSCALDLCITVLANPGQNILVPRPGFSIYRTLAEGLGIRTKAYNLLPERDWEVDLDSLEAAVDADTAAIVINNPSNPCGSVFSREHLLDILAIAARHRVPIIGDEIYEHLVFPGQRYHSLGSLSEEVPILSCSGLTKRFLVPGWRMGWIVIHDRHDVLGAEVRAGLQKLSQRIIGSNTLVQGALPAILRDTPESFFQDTIHKLHHHARVAYARLRRVPGLSPVMPQGAMYMMVGLDMDRFPAFRTDLQLVDRLVREESVFLLPGQCFDLAGYVRLVLTVPEEQLREACARIEAFCLRHYQGAFLDAPGLADNEVALPEDIEIADIFDKDEMAAETAPPPQQQQQTQACA
ncbi:Tyrosine aminotransferase [Frankliniella fusca]|uniref:Tyrosine aminotransferase n=1 Tax=Frankliniella fusca TaxID=407009 RepID=A0AAE1GXA1_9NEOP|nr:Tyrosine aminotransferase [Frankliniella fusca]